MADLFVHLGLDLETYGNAFLQVIRSKRDRRIIGLHRLPAITMTRYRAGFLQRVTGADGKEKKRTYTAQEVIHLRDLCPRGFRYALPTWIGVEDMLELAHAATRYNAAFFKNGAMPEYAVIFKGQQATKEAKQEIRDFFRNEHQGVDQAHRTMVLQSSDDGSVEFEKLTADVKDGDFLKLLDASRDRIPVAHGTPPRVLGIMTAGQLGGGGEVAGQLFTFEHLTLKPRRRRMLDQLRPLLRELGLKPGDPDQPPGDNEILFRPLDLTPPKDDAEQLPDLVNAGIVTPEEARALLPIIAAGAQSATEAPQGAVSKSDDNSHLAALAAILTRL